MVDFHVRQSIEQPDADIASVFFPNDGIISVVAGVGRLRVEVGIIGRDGMTGTAVVLGGTSSRHECFVQVAGSALTISAEALRVALDERPTMLRRFLAYVQAFMAQTAETAVANGRMTIEQRLARWLLMTQDRLGRDEIPLTHEFLSVMVGTWRPRVTVALQQLEGDKAIRNSRGRILVVDRAKLQAAAGPLYRGP